MWLVDWYASYSCNAFGLGCWDVARWQADIWLMVYALTLPCTTFTYSLCYWISDLIVQNYLRYWCFILQIQLFVSGVSYHFRFKSRLCWPYSLQSYTFYLPSFQITVGVSYQFQIQLYAAILVVYCYCLNPLCCHFSSLDPLWFVDLGESEYQIGVVSRSYIVCWSFE